MRTAVETISYELGLSRTSATKIIKLLQLGAPVGPWEHRVREILARYPDQYFIWTGTRLVPWRPPFHEQTAATG